MLTDSNHTSWGDDLIIWATGEPLCCILETNIRLHINCMSIEIKIKQIILQINK